MELYGVAGIISNDDVVETNSSNLPTVAEPALASAIKRKWRRRLQSRGLRLVLTPALDEPRGKETHENIGLHCITGRG